MDLHQITKSTICVPRSSFVSNLVKFYSAVFVVVLPTEVYGKFKGILHYGTPLFSRPLLDGSL